MSPDKYLLANGEYPDEWPASACNVIAALEAERDEIKAKLEAMGWALVLLYDDVSDHLPNDVLALVTDARAAQEQKER